MKIFLATDHAGVDHKNALRHYLVEKGMDVEDMGTDSTESCDYPDFIMPAARAVAEDPENRRAFVFGGSGQGEAMTANRVKGVRATTYYHHDLDILELSRSHNGANILSIGARFVSVEEMKEAADKWLGMNEALEERHARRVAKIDTV
ncbi:MAG: RpiB/LacA/LacB family sugar-phosphate isomerase [Candidatus Gracilibacteria bacterium]|nr:RpiB/LacA/LacB family sugar-phosphate isomerase [Candidatus Gracilibacteria bacterium]